MVVAAALGVGAAAALGAGDDGVVACANKRSGAIHIARPDGRCLKGSFAITISGNAFKRRGGTLTINGVAFRKGPGRTITINGNTFRTGTLPNTITINGVPFETGGGTLTINGLPLTPGAAGPAGPPGPEGNTGPTGPPGIPYGPKPFEASTAVSAAAGGSAEVASVNFTNTDGLAHRVLVTGGFDAVCTSCSAPTTPGWSLERAGDQLVTRRLSRLANGDTAGASVSEIVVMPSDCNPCDLTLKLFVLQDPAGGSLTVDATHRRLGIVDLGPVTP